MAKRASLVLIGFTAVVAQVVLMRELMVVFYGNELSLGIMLAAWLLWTAFGSGVLPARAPMPALQAAVAVALPATVFAVRAAPLAFAALPGEMLGPGPMLVTTLAALSLFCTLSGWLFAAGVRVYGGGQAAGTVYLLEAAGSAVGGLLAGLVLVRWWTSFEIVLFLALLNAAAALWLTLGRRAAALALLPLVAVPWAARRLESKGAVETRDSPYGRLAVIDTAGSRGLFENGLLIASVPDPAAAEESVDFALLQHPAPATLLLIGGGAAGSIPEALRHGLRRIDYAELDPLIPEFARRYFGLRPDPRVAVHTTDGRAFLRGTRQAFDVIIVNLPDPQNAQLNRFYTVEFFREAARRLTPGGVLSFRVSASENYIGPELAAFLRSMNATLGAVFPNVAAIPGESAHFFASAGALTVDPRVFAARLRERGLDTRYVSEAFLPFRLSPDRMADLEARIRPEASTRVNRDFAPIVYYFGTAFWSSRFRAGQALFGWIAAVALCSSCLLALLLRRRPAGYCVAATGYTTIGLEMMLLVGFQAIHGYLYDELAVVVAGFMAGAALGSWAGLRSRALSLARLQWMLAAAPLLLFGFLACRLDFAPLFPASALLCGALGGWQFPVACRVSGKPRNPGALYALDLLGASIAALVFSTLLLPLLGFFQTAALTALLNAAPALSARRTGE